MAEPTGAGAGAAPLLPGLPDEISVWEILVRLPPKCILRCRAVCPAWRRATSARDFLLAHHSRQPTLPILYNFNFVGGIKSLSIVPFDHRAGVAAADQLRSVARLEYDISRMEACCDGLLVLSVHRTLEFCICNPATRQYALLPQLHGFAVLGMYRHPPTGEYRLLLYLVHTDLVPEAQDGSYVFTLGSGQPPRYIGCPEAKGLRHYTVPNLFRGNLHWCTDNLMIAFDITTELFRLVCFPVGPGYTRVIEMGDMLGISRLNDAAASVDIWVMPDYEGEIWTLKYRVELPAAEITEQFAKSVDYWYVVAVPWDGDVLLLVRFDDWLIQVDINGKVVASFHCRGDPAHLWLKQTLVHHTFFPTLEGYVVNSLPFV